MTESNSSGRFRVALWAGVSLLAFLLLVAWGCGTETPASLAEPQTTSSPQAETVSPAPAASPTPTASPTPSPRWPITLAAVGDVMLARSVSTAITADRPEGPFADVLGVLQNADVTVGNLECAISEGGKAEPKAYTFRAPPLAAAGLARAGFDVVALANNHSLDYGVTALADTLENLKAASVAAVGAGRNAEEAYGYRVLDVAGVSVAFAAFVEVPNEAGYNMAEWAAGKDEPGVAWVDRERVAATISAARDASDVVVAMFHFGVEGSAEPTARQRELARLAIESGASLVVGSHPHVLQKVEEYKGGLIAYSLGNFVFDGFEGSANESAILLVTFAADGTLSWQLDPVVIGWDGLPHLVD